MCVMLLLIPPEIIIHVLFHLPYRDIIACSLVSTSLVSFYSDLIFTGRYGEKFLFEGVQVRAQEFLCVLLVTALMMKDGVKEEKRERGD